MPGSSSRTVVPVMLLTVLVVVGLNTWFAVGALQSLRDSEAWLAHTWEVIGQEERIFASLTTAESSARGYVIAGDDAFLAPYHQMQVILPQQIDQFQALTADNTVQQKYIEDLRGVSGRRMSWLQSSIDKRREAGFQAAQSIIITRSGASEMDQARDLVGKMDAEEHRLLLSRRGEAGSNAQRAMFAIGLASALDLLLMIFISRYFLSERKMRVASEALVDKLAAARLEAERSAAEIKLLNEELEERVRQRTAELETTNRELEAFSYSVSHDLRAPLRTIDGFSLALMEDYSEAVDETGRDYIGRVRAGVQRMGGLIDALLQLSRITRAEIVRESINLVPIAESVVAALRDENPGRDMTFTLLPGPNVDADPRLVQVALENLLGNAVKFTARRSHADIEFGWDPEAAAWRVRDNGAGFDMHYADKLFNAFNRLHGDKDFKGSGIGLATVARVIRRHHGRIWADSQVDHGATFWFTLG